MLDLCRIDTLRATGSVMGRLTTMLLSPATDRSDADAAA